MCRLQWKTCYEMFFFKKIFQLELHESCVSCCTSEMKLFLNFLTISFKDSEWRSISTVCAVVQLCSFCEQKVKVLSFDDGSIATQRHFLERLTLPTLNKPIDLVILFSLSLFRQHVHGNTVISFVDL